MSEASRTLSPETWTVINSVISLPESADGLLPYALPDGRTISPSGLAHALASLSARQVKELGLQTSGIFGRRGSISSASETLQSSLESRLRARIVGSTLCTVTWKQWVTPWGQCRSRPRASVRTISGIDTGLWRTPNAHVIDAKSSVVKLDGRKPTDPQVGLADQVMALWPTPTSLAPAKGDNNEAGNSAGLVAIRTHAIGSSDTTEKPGALDPAFVSWLMGYPPEWCDCAVTAMQSFPKSPRSSSRRTSKAGSKS